MTKSVVVRLFWGSLLGVVAGSVLLVAAAALALGGQVFTTQGPDVTGISPGPLAWVLLALAGLALVLIVISAIAQFVAWIGAVIATAYLPDKRWCVALAVVGVFGLFSLATLVYVLAGPDGTVASSVAPSAPSRRPGMSAAG